MTNNTTLSKNYADTRKFATMIVEWVDFVNSTIESDCYDHWNMHVKNAKQNFQKFYNKRFINFRREVNWLKKYYLDSMAEEYWNKLVTMSVSEWVWQIQKGKLC